MNDVFNFYDYYLDQKAHMIGMRVEKGHYTVDGDPVSEPWGNLPVIGYRLCYSESGEPVEHCGNNYLEFVWTREKLEAFLRLAFDHLEITW